MVRPLLSLIGLALVVMLCLWLVSPVRTHVGNHIHAISRIDGHLIGTWTAENHARFLKSDKCRTCQREGKHQCD